MVKFFMTHDVIRYNKRGEKMKETIEHIKKLYDTRDMNMIEDVFHRIYGNNSKPILIGTSNAELYFDKEDIIKLFRSDLESWGDVYIDSESINIHSIGPYQVVNVAGKIRQTFFLTDETYKGFSNNIDEISQSTTSTHYQKLTLILQLLSHLLSDRTVGKRCYDWDLEIDFVIKNKQAHLMMFSMPINELTPDVRLDDFDDYNYRIYQRELKIMEAHAHADDYPDVLLFINEYIKQVKQASDVYMSSKQSIMDCDENYIYFMGIGYYFKSVTLEERLNHIMTHLYENDEPKRRLFNIRRDISNHLLHDAIGEQMKVHFRVIGVVSKHEDHYHMGYIKISLPFNLILEEKTNDLLIHEGK